MQQPVHNYYNSNIDDLELVIKKIRKKISYFYFIRLIVFIIFIVFFILFFKHNNYLFLCISFSNLLLFLYVLKQNLSIVYKEKVLSNKLAINKNELKYLEHNYHDKNSGQEYNYINPHLSADFEIFGNGSLFQYLNRCSTIIGKNKFAENLCKSELDAVVIKTKQEAISELSLKNEFTQNFQSYGMLISEDGNELSSLNLWLNETAEKLKLLQILAFAMPLIFIVNLTLAIIGVFSFNALILATLCNLLIIYFNKQKISKTHLKLGRTAKTFEKYSTLIKLIENEDFKSSYLVNLKQQLSNRNIKASKSLSKLFNLLNSFDTRYNVFVWLILNSLFIFDIQIYCRLAKWKEKHKTVIDSWFNTLSEIDKLICFSVYAFNNQSHISYPEISEKEFAFEATYISHPLIHPKIRISNNISFSGKPTVIIITGANMAGKSTFLRTLSINLILAMNGAPVCAKNLVFSPCDIMSSIKIQDSLSNNESYFYAELIRLKEIINNVKNNPKTFVILDEILRGTNTKDKQLGSLGLLEKLISQKSIVIIATHDLTIGELEKKYPNIVKNYCFEVDLTNDQLIFDYKLNKGISTKLNASFLMKKMEIID